MLVQAEFVALHPGTAAPGRFCMMFATDARPRGLVVHVAPFAEELNKTRRMVSQQARRFAASGFSVVVPDLLGCGDSPGRFEDATWNDWRRDVVASATWMRDRHAGLDVPLWLWGTRLGALLAAQCAEPAKAQGLLFWEPVLDAARHLQQFLRIADTQPRPAARHTAPRAHAAAQLASGQPVDIAGYRITPALAEGMREAQPPVLGCDVICVQQRSPHGERQTPVSLRHARDITQRNSALRVFEASGPAFWHQVEAEDAADWWEVTTRAMTEGFE